LEESKRKGISRNFDSKIRNVINVDLLWNPQGTGREEDREIAGEYR
jgi:hypothetical protein